MEPVNEKRVSIADLKDRLSYDPDTGVITWVKTHIKALVGAEAGGIRSYHTGAKYRVISFQKVGILSHRVAWALQHNEWPDGFVDHINGNTLDNRLCNLRVVTKSQNCHNTGLRSVNTSGFAGVGFRPDRNKWKATITVARKKHYIGLYETAEEAGAAYLAAAARLVGDFKGRLQ